MPVPRTRPVPLGATTAACLCLVLWSGCRSGQQAGTPSATGSGPAPEAVPSPSFDARLEVLLTRQPAYALRADAGPERPPAPQVRVRQRLLEEDGRLLVELTHEVVVNQSPSRVARVETRALARPGLPAWSYRSWSMGELEVELLREGDELVGTRLGSPLRVPLPEGTVLGAHLPWIAALLPAEVGAAWSGPVLRSVLGGGPGGPGSDPNAPASWATDWEVRRLERAVDGSWRVRCGDVELRLDADGCVRSVDAGPEHGGYTIVDEVP